MTKEIRSGRHCVFNLHALAAGLTPTANGGHVTFELPERNVSKHVWSHWSGIRKKLRVAYKAHVRSGASKDNPAPLSDLLALSPYRTLTVKSRQANRFRYCSGNVETENPQDLLWNGCLG